MPPTSIYDLRNPATLSILGAIFLAAMGGAMSFKALQAGQEQTHQEAAQNREMLAQVLEGQKADAMARKELELTVSHHGYEISSLNEWRKEVSAPSRARAIGNKTAESNQ